jgi:tetratricopeptide (TPR) repeat protein
MELGRFAIRLLVAVFAVAWLGVAAGACWAAGGDGDSQRAKALYQSAVHHLESGRWYARAVALLEEAVRLDPGNTDYREALGCAYAARALDLLLLSLSGGVGGTRADRQALVASSDIAQITGPLVKRAVEELDAAISVAPDVAGYHHTLGWIYLADAREGLSGDAEAGAQAEQQFLEAVRLNPGVARYRRSLGDLYRLMPNLPGAKGKPAAAASTAPSTPVNPALKMYSDAATLDPSDPGLWFMLYTYHAQGSSQADAAQAQADLQRAWRLDPTNSLYRYLTAWLLTKQADEADLPPDQKDALLSQALLEVQAANNMPDLRVAVYTPAFPRSIAWPLGQLMGATELNLSQPVNNAFRDIGRRFISLGGDLERDGSLNDAAVVYEAVLAMGNRLAAAASAMDGGPGSNLVQLSTGLAIQQTALRPLTELYLRYGAPQQVLAAQQKQRELDYMAQLLSAEMSPPPTSPSG